MDNINAMTNIELEAGLYRQEHRLIYAFKNYFVIRKRFQSGDIRKKAIVSAFYHNLFFNRVVYTIGGGSLIAVVISFYILKSSQEQNFIVSRANLFAQAGEIQKIIVEHPELLEYIYNSKKSLDSTSDLDTKIRVAVICEMYADMLDHAAGSHIFEAKDGWLEYALFIYSNSEVFRKFIKDKKDWYPKLYDYLDENFLIEKR
ncbi:MAG: hypothetical protein HY964_00620 [Ignavibacteriales bacterium]|nr:hypothetical protein [Ignavibacteriales bacterium]